MDRGAWRAVVHVATQNRTRLKQPSTAQHSDLVVQWSRLHLPVRAVWV